MYFADIQQVADNAATMATASDALMIPGGTTSLVLMTGGPRRGHAFAGEIGGDISRGTARCVLMKIRRTIFASLSSIIRSPGAPGLGR
jgi:hypothetical protein